MPNLNPHDRAAFKELEDLIRRISPQWKAHPNIIDIVPALRTKAGRVQTEMLVLGFYVREKLPSDLLRDRGYPPIPAEIEGVPTDVILGFRRPSGNVDTKSTRSQMFDTLAGGMAVGNADMNAYGTLGMILFAQSDGRPVGLTNEHVLVFDTDGQVGDEVQQPRFYLNSQVSIDPAACCPNGQLHYRGVDNPIVDAFLAVYTAAIIAAALSDEIDPHRRGQVATVPDPMERTLRETVSVDLQYPELPLPGTPYKLGVKWKYKRETDRRSLEHAVEETKRNEHVIQTQELLTDRLVYTRGNRVVFLALLSSERPRKSCHNFFVTAAALSPSHRKSYKIVLNPCAGEECLQLLHRIAPEVKEQSVIRRCVTFGDQKPDSRFQKQRVIGDMIFDPKGATVGFTQATRKDQITLRLPSSSLIVRFHRPVQEVSARVLLNRGESTRMTAFNGRSQVGNDTAANTRGKDLKIEAATITHVVFDGGDNNAQLERICVARKLEHFCIYRGEMPLASDEELGIWSTFLFAQTRNDVPLGTDKLIAAQTIGGLPVTNNFASGGEADNITYGHSCLVDLVQNGSFEVRQPPAQDIR